jgi:TRAP-type C4-dicarboxylate transport system permease small subunit
MTDVSKPSWLGQALAWAARLSRIGVWVGGSLTLASVLLISYDVIVRRLFGVTMGGSDELSSYAFAISTSWALAYTALERANVRVDVVYQHLPVRLAAVLDWVALVSLGVFAVVLTYHTQQVACNRGRWVPRPTRRWPRRCGHRSFCGWRAWPGSVWCWR